MAAITHQPAAYRIELSQDEAAAFAALCRIDVGSALRALRKDMGNIIIPPSCDKGMESLFASCRKSESLKDFMSREFAYLAQTHTCEQLIQ